MRLTKARGMRGETPGQVAQAALDQHRNTIVRIESGAQGVKKHQLDAICEHLGITGVERSYLHTLRVRSNERGWWEPYFDAGSGSVVNPAFPMFLETEQVAEHIRVLESELIPGLLQTPEYLAALQAAQAHVPEDVLASIRDLRSRRQQLMYSRAELPHMEFIVGPGAIRYLHLLDPEVRDSQVRRLLELAENPKVNISVPKGLHPGAGHGFNILDADGGTFLFLDALDGCRYVENSPVVSLHKEVFAATQAMTVTIEEYLYDS
nr:helix-turn-helix transcriptional regulator [Natronoglycomyces albus]